jgi:hypothetical protein
MRWYFPPREFSRSLLQETAGQAMAEYAIVVSFLVGGMTVMGFTFLPDFINALQRYYDSYYIIINLPVP